MPRAKLPSNWSERPFDLSKDQIEALLCGIVTQLGAKLPAVLDRVDWAEVGLPRQAFDGWWLLHQAKDKLRREPALKLAKQARQAWIKSK